jgi:hypothetical protein
MTKTIERLGDRLLSLVVPRLTAAAESGCDCLGHAGQTWVYFCSCECIGPAGVARLNHCYCDGCHVLCGGCQWTTDPCWCGY